MKLNNKPAFVQIMVWRRNGDQSLSKTIMAKFTDAYMCYPGLMG